MGQLKPDWNIESQVSKHFQEIFASFFRLLWPKCLLGSWPHQEVVLPHVRHAQASLLLNNSWISDGNRQIPLENLGKQELLLHPWHPFAMSWKPSSQVKTLQITGRLRARAMEQYLLKALATTFKTQAIYNQKHQINSNRQYVAKCGLARSHPSYYIFHSL